MDSRERFLKTMGFGQPDRPPFFEEGIREEVLQMWRVQGLPPGASLGDIFPLDRRVEVQLDLDPHPYPERWPLNFKDIEPFEASLDPDAPTRLPPGLLDELAAEKSRGSVLMFRVHEGFFLSLGVEGWGRFSEVMALIVDSPELIEQMMAIKGWQAARLAARVLEKIHIDAAVFSEPIGGNHGPLISPKMYRRFVVPSLCPLMEILRSHGVQTILMRTYANTRILLPVMVEMGINALWAVEADPRAMDYRSIRREFGSRLGLIGGLDLDKIRKGREACRAEILAKVPPLLALGGYIPLADGRVRTGISWDQYRYYREFLMETVARSGVPSVGHG